MTFVQNQDYRVYFKLSISDFYVIVTDRLIAIQKLQVEDNKSQHTQEQKFNDIAIYILLKALRFLPFRA